MATKLNGYLTGVGGLENFKREVDTMGLTPTQKEYCTYYVEKNEGQGLYCWQNACGDRTCGKLDVKIKKYTS